MYPNPQDALPLPSRPNLQQYKKVAKDLVKACRSDDPAAIRLWAHQWIAALASAGGDVKALRDADDIASHTTDVEEFARKQLSGGGGSPRCVLADAQFVIARAHGFLSWPKFAKHIESLAVANSSTSAFESAASAIIAGDVSTLQRLLREHPDLIHTRSTREHRASLLHYVSANGVEGYRQISPQNIAAITELLLAAGADVDAEADVYAGRCTPLGLVATSGPPAVAGVQREVIDVLLAHGARMDRPGLAGHTSSLVRACLANGQPEAAEYLASRGAPLDLAGAAGLGRVDALQGLVARDGSLTAHASQADVADAFALACAYGRAGAVAYFLDHGMAVDAELRGHGEGHTGLHVAAYHAHGELVDLLLRRGARVDAIDKTWGTPPLLWALTGWSREPTGPDAYYRVVARLVAAGASVTQKQLEWDKVRADPRMFAALTGETQPDSPSNEAR